MNPYTKLDEKHFWKPAVGVRKPLEVSGLWSPKFEISKSDKVVTYGSCFAQHIGRALKARGYKWKSMEVAPEGMSDVSAATFNYGIFSSRTGNIYTTSLLKQWVAWANDAAEVPDEVWQRGDRFIDPFRPVVEPDGFRSVEELKASQKETIKSFRNSILRADVFVFTLGLTESWFNAELGYEYPMCPGTIAGEFDATQHAFKNQNFASVIGNLCESMAMMKEMNPDLQFLLTVSPVPLTATYSGNHVLTATMHSKSILRAVAGQLAAERSDTDYFPSYEIITSPVFEGQFYEKNKRSVQAKGVAFVMDSFFDCMLSAGAMQPVDDSPPMTKQSATISEETTDDVHCEEEFLEAFAPGLGKE